MACLRKSQLGVRDVRVQVASGDGTVEFEEQHALHVSGTS